MNGLWMSEILRAGHVRRWHIVAMAREQTVADHMWRVQAITFQILKTIGHGTVDSNLFVNAMEWARIHDLPEVVIGDMPTNAKKGLAAFSDLDGNGGPNPMVSLERKLDDHWRMVHDTVCQESVCPEAGDIVKVADLAEACNYCKIFGLGDHARTVHMALMGDLSKKLVGIDGKLKSGRYGFENWDKARSLVINIARGEQ